MAVVFADWLGGVVRKRSCRQLCMLVTTGVHLLPTECISKPLVTFIYGHNFHPRMIPYAPIFRFPTPTVSDPSRFFFSDYLSFSVDGYLYCNNCNRTEQRPWMEFQNAKCEALLRKRVHAKSWGIPPRLDLQVNPSGWAKNIDIAMRSRASRPSGMRPRSRAPRLKYWCAIHLLLLYITTRVGSSSPNSWTSWPI